MKSCTIEGCGRPYYGKGLCNTHYARQRRTGTTEDPVTISKRERFERHLPPRPGDNSCWEWRSSRYDDGYGQFSSRRAHRVAYELYVGPIPDGMQILHSCDNPPCCLPAHLSLGTNAENVADMVAKGRHIHGERHYKARFTADDVREMRRKHAEGQSKSSIAREYGGAESNIWAILDRVTWKHIS